MNRALAPLLTARCPHCRSIAFRSVGSRNAVEQAIRWFMLTYRCALCGRHFYLARWMNALGEMD